MNKRWLVPRLAAVLAAPLLAIGSAQAADRIKAVASFSILGDMVRQVGGDRVEVVTLVGPNGDAHVYQPTPADAKHLGAAKVLVVNGLVLQPGFMVRAVRSCTESNDLIPRFRG